MAPAAAEDTAVRTGARKRILRNVSVLMGGRALNAPLALLHTSLAIRLLGAHDFGLVVLLYAFARTVGDIVDFQSWQTTLHFGMRPLTDGNKHDFQRILRFSLVLDALGGVGGMLVGIGFSSLARQWLGWPDSMRLLGPIFCLSIPFMASATPIGILRIRNRFDLISAQSVVATIIRLVGTLLLCVTHGNLVAMAVVWMLAEVAACLVLFHFAFRELRSMGFFAGLLRFDRSARRDLLEGRLSRDFPGIWQFALTTNVNATLTLAFSHVGTLIVGALLGPASAGYYRIGSQIASGIAKPATLVQSTLYPEMARLWTSGATKRLYLLAGQAALASGALGSALLLAAWFLGGSILRLVIGPHGEEALPVTLWLLAAEVVAIWGIPLEPLLFTMRRVGAVIIARSVDAMLYLPLLVATIEWYGLDGVGPTTVAATLFLIMMQLGFVARLHDKSARATNAPMAASSAMDA